MNDDTASSALQRLMRFDEERPSVPGEHWLTFAAGLYLVLRPSDSAAGRLVSLAGGALLIARALSGRDGAIAFVRQHARLTADPRYVEVAAPWPYDHRVRIASPKRTRARREAPARTREETSAA